MAPNDSQIDNVSLVKKANTYFDGKVTSRTAIQADGSKITLGIMMPGDYEFSTLEKEIIEILAGKLEVLLPNTREWKSLGEGDSFEVPANAKFNLKVEVMMDYLCSYISA